MKIVEESAVMRALRWMGMDKLAWALRRYHCPVPAGALVLEVGSGGNPYVRANVLLDAYEDTRERHWELLVTDRPMVIGFVENLPFRDGAFDFVIASHVLEHSVDPERFLAELQRVARSGYIEVPDAFMERINPYRDHRLEITVRNARLQIRKKGNWRIDPDLVELYEDRAKKWVARELIPSRPFDFHVRHYWSGTIEFDVVNPEVDNQWSADADTLHANGEPGGMSLRSRLRHFLRRFASQGRRNRNIDLLALLRCPACHSTELKKLEASLRCKACDSSFSMEKGYPHMLACSRNERNTI